MPDTRKIEDISASVIDVLDKDYATKGRGLAENLPKLRRKLPRKARLAAEKIAQTEYRAKYQPYVPAGDIKAAQRAGKELAKTANVDSAAERRIGRKNWAARLIINLGLMCVAIWVFWLIGTR